MRFLLPVTAILALVIGALIWLVSSAEVRRTERAYESQLTELAVASRYMIHGAAAEYCRSHNLVFHRLGPGQPLGSGPAAGFERQALLAFDRDPELGYRSIQYRDEFGTQWLYVLAPARLQEECASCHAANNVSVFDGRRVGDLVGAFGVSANTGPLQHSVTRMRLLAALLGLAGLGLIGLVVTYFVRQSILRPLAGLTGSIVRMGRGDLDVHAQVLSQDEIGQLAASFNRMVEQLRESNKDYMEVLAFVSHELKNPIASMITDARVLADGYLGPLEPAQALKLERLMRMGNHLLELIREYLELARMEGGELNLRARPTAFLDEVAEPAVELILAQMQNRRMTLERSYPEAPQPVQCDPSLLKIVLVNLLGNAVKYGWEGGTVRLTVQHRADRLRVEVWNEGPGFPAEERSRLFRKFSRLRSPELMERKGTGIGLYTAMRIVQLHGGSMDARSEYEHWAEFRVEIPQPLPAQELRTEPAAEQLPLQPRLQAEEG